MERKLEEKMAGIMNKPGVVGAICVDNKGLTLSDDSSSSSDDCEMAGSPKKSPKKAPDEILSGSVRSASFNIIFQVITRVFTFMLNAFILRYVSHDVLGICNVRLALLYSSVMFLSREPFRRAVLRKSESDSWLETINLIWLVIPCTVFWSVFLGLVWCYLLSQPGAFPDSAEAVQYRLSVWVMCFALVVDSFTEVPYILGQYFLFYRLRIVGDTLLIAVRSFCLCIAVVKFPSTAIFSYAFGTLVGVICVSSLYYGYFYYYIHNVARRDLPFGSISALLPRSGLRFPKDLQILAWTFFKQGILKQLLTEGERYMMTFLDVLTFKEQGIYDLVANLGSLAARFVFLPIEESSYSYFAQSLQKQAKSVTRTKELMVEIGAVLGRLVRMMSLVGMVIIVYGLPFSNTVLFLYGGSRLSDEGPGTRLLQANCINIFTLALNGVTEAFTFAAMSKDQMDKFNKRLVWFSGIYLFAAWILTSYFGSIGFFIANSINMSLRIIQSCTLVQLKFSVYKINPFNFWLPKVNTIAVFGMSTIVIWTLSLFDVGRVLFVLVGLVIFATNCLAALYFDKDLTSFFLNIYKTKSA
ncbi:Protein RFT1 [Orchesella cincta]|uniref:Protein RFT1 homolog n=1 Tax=Orchesella cincta TaxID=48709 RepID=A0A1D2N4M3_ORCCI|nr:Protein RFT1 [Orchesella cincta]